MTPGALGVAGSPSASSRSRLLVARTLSHLASAGMATQLLDLLDLPGDALLRRRTDPAIDRAVAATLSADVLVVGTPVYRATYSAQLKGFFDLLPQDGLRGHVVGLIATGQAEAHYLAIDNGLRPLVASLGGIGAPNGVYVTNARFPDLEQLPDPVDAALIALAGELRALADAARASMRIRVAG